MLSISLLITALMNKEMLQMYVEICFGPLGIYLELLNFQYKIEVCCNVEQNLTKYCKLIICLFVFIMNI